MDTPERHPYGEALEAKGAGGDCPACGKRNNGLWLHGPSALTFVLDPFNPHEFHPMVCGNCGFLRLHAIPFLKEREQDDASG